MIYSNFLSKVSIKTQGWYAWSTTASSGHHEKRPPTLNMLDRLEKKVGIFTKKGTSMLEILEKVLEISEIKS